MFDLSCSLIVLSPFTAVQPKAGQGSLGVIPRPFMHMVHVKRHETAEALEQ